MGRLVYVREVRHFSATLWVLPSLTQPQDREAEPRFAAPGGRGDLGSGGRGGYGGGGGFGGGSRQIFVSNLPYNVGWQDMKDLFRGNGQFNVVRADVHLGPDGRPKGSGIVAFETPEDAQGAIQQFNGYDWQGRPLEVREDRFANNGPPYSRGGGFAGGRGGFAGRGAGFGGRGGFDGGFRGGRGGFGGGFGGGSADFSGGNVGAAPNEFTDYATGNGDRSATIFVRNLPWSTSNEDLVDLFTTIGKVERAEIQYEPNGRSRGTGVVQFDSDETAAVAIDKFSGYLYGGRSLGLTFVKYQVPGAEMEGVTGGLTQGDIM